MAASTHVVTLAGPSAQDLSSSVQQKAGQGHILSCGSSSIGCGNSSPGRKRKFEEGPFPQATSSSSNNISNGNGNAPTQPLFPTSALKPFLVDSSNNHDRNGGNGGSSHGGGDEADRPGEFSGVSHASHGVKQAVSAFTPSAPPPPTLSSTLPSSTEPVYDGTLIAAAAAASAAVGAAVLPHPVPSSLTSSRPSSSMPPPPPRPPYQLQQQEDPSSPPICPPSLPLLDPSLVSASSFPSSSSSPLPLDDPPPGEGFPSLARRKELMDHTIARLKEEMERLRREGRECALLKFYGETAVATREEALKDAKRHRAHLLAVLEAVARHGKEEADGKLEGQKEGLREVMLEEMVGELKECQEALRVAEAEDEGGGREGGKEGGVVVPARTEEEAEEDLHAITADDRFALEEMEAVGVGREAPLPVVEVRIEKRGVYYGDMHFVKNDALVVTNARIRDSFPAILQSFNQTEIFLKLLGKKAMTGDTLASSRKRVGVEELREGKFLLAFAHADSPSSSPSLSGGRSPLDSLGSSVGGGRVRWVDEEGGRGGRRGGR
ncbi:Hypothetical protein NocV09_03700060 [Nannochloropsis oceanica]